MPSRTTRKPSTTTALTVPEITTVRTTLKPTEVMINVTAKPFSMLICPNGRLPLIDKMGRSIECEIPEDALNMKTDSCGGSKEHQCAFLSLNSTRGICCLRLNYEQTRCPSSMKPLVDVDSRQVRPCSPLNSDSCDGPESVCVFDELYGDYHCCHPLAVHPIIPTSPTKVETSTTTTTSTTATTTTSLVTTTTTAMTTTTPKTTTILSMTTILARENQEGYF